MMRHFNIKSIVTDWQSCMLHACHHLGLAVVHDRLPVALPITHMALQSEQAEPYPPLLEPDSTSNNFNGVVTTTMASTAVVNLYLWWYQWHLLPPKPVITPPPLSTAVAQHCTGLQVVSSLKPTVQCL
jgi:hypothetical protein